MKALKYLSFVGKIAGLVSALNVIPFVDPKVGVIVFAAASILKDAVNRIGDLLDDGEIGGNRGQCANLDRISLSPTLPACHEVCALNFLVPFIE